MSCQKIQRTISDAIDSRIDLPDTIEQHLRQCADCRSFYQTARTFNQLFNTAYQPSETAVRGIEHRVMASLDTIPNTVSKSRTLWLGTAAAAMILITMSLFYYYIQPAQPALSRQPVGVNALAEAVQRKWMNSQLDTAILQSPLENEFEELVSSGRCAAGFLVACLNPGLSGPGQTTADYSDQD